MFMFVNILGPVCSVPTWRLNCPCIWNAMHSEYHVWECPLNVFMSVHMQWICVKFDTRKDEAHTLKWDKAWTLSLYNLIQYQNAIYLWDSGNPSELHVPIPVSYSHCIPATYDSRHNCNCEGRCNCNCVHKQTLCLKTNLFVYTCINAKEAVTTLNNTLAPEVRQ